MPAVVCEMAKAPGSHLQKGSARGAEGTASVTEPQNYAAKGSAAYVRDADA